MKNLIKRALGKPLVDMAVEWRRGRAFNRRGATYSQEGEDRVLSSLLFKLHGGRHIGDGFYVDVGAHHPFRYSNTCLFYEMGWRGINIDAMPGSMRAFSKHRPRDINIECGIGRNPGTLEFHVFNESALNTFDSSLANARAGGPEGWRIERVVRVPIRPLGQLLSEHVPEGQGVDFMSVDVEGLDLEVLESNDWQSHRPMVVLAETYGVSIEELDDNPLATYMRSLGYMIYAKTVNTTLFTDRKAVESVRVASLNQEEGSRSG